MVNGMDECSWSGMAWRRGGIAVPAEHVKKKMKNVIFISPLCSPFHYYVCRTYIAMLF